MAILYKNPKGFNVMKHSYSAGGDFRKCRRYYFLKRVEGWQEKTRAAAFEFGKALESALQFYHDNGLKPGSMAEEFTRLWTKVKEISNMEYKDESWDDLAVMGADMGRLYEAVLPTLPFGTLVPQKNPKFQLNYEKELYPGTYLAGIKFTAYVDMLVTPWMDGTSADNLKADPIIVDIKTTGQAYDETPNIHALDQQLRAYSWVSGIRKTAFLVFVKTSPSIKKGDTVTVLSKYLLDHDTVQPGTRVKILVAAKDGEPNHVVLNLDVYAKYREASAGLKGKAADEALKLFDKEHGIPIAACAVTKQRLQFLPATISDQRTADTGAMIGEQAAQIVNATESNSFPEDGGTRFPNAVCTWCCMRGICTGNDKLRDELIFRETEKDNWLDELTEGE